MKPSAWLTLILLLTPCLAQGQDVPPDKQDDYTKITNHFFDKVKSGEFTDAAHVLIDTNPQDAFNVEKHESLAVPLQKIADTFGPFKDFKPLVSKTLGDGIGYIYGLAIYERGPIRFEFMFYKDGTSWRLLHVDFNLNYVPEIRDLAGVHVQSPPVYAPGPLPSAVKPKVPDNPEPAAAPAAPSVPPTLSTPTATPPASSPATAPTPVPSPTTAPQNN